MRQVLLRSIAIVALAAVVLGGTGCRTSEKPAASAGSEATRSVDTTASGATQSVEPLGPADVEALEKELDAIERELETLDLPSDSDFDDIEGAL